MIGIEKICFQLGEDQIDNFDRKEELDVSEEFILNKIGARYLSRKKADQETSDLAAIACEKIFSSGLVKRDEIGCLVVVSQNPDGYGLPHTSAILQNMLGINSTCACFDVSLGCSGFVYGLSIISSFMSANNILAGLLVTADPYSKVVESTDRNTSLLFGDGAAATLISDTPVWTIGAFDFGTDGSLSDHLIIDENRNLQMNGRGIFSFSATKVPLSIQKAMDANSISLDDIDRVILHQGSKFIVDTIGKKINAQSKTLFYAGTYGNTVSSSIPIAMAEAISEDEQTILVSGFGVGLSWASTVLDRVIK